MKSLELGEQPLSEANTGGGDRTAKCLTYWWEALLCDDRQEHPCSP